MSAGASDAASAILRHVEDSSRRYHAALEAACERAIQGGVCGVLVIREGPGAWLIGPHWSVPYGQIHEYPQGAGDETQYRLGLSGRRAGQDQGGQMRMDK